MVSFCGERHALEAKLEGQIECWDGMYFHIDLWSREARQHERPDVVGYCRISASRLRMP